MNQPVKNSPGIDSSSTFPKSLLWVPRSTVTELLTLYDYSRPDKPAHVIRGYDKQHALRTAKMCAAVAYYLGHSTERVRSYQVACLLHDLGRAGLDQKLFGRIWSWARQQNIPTRPAEWRASHPETSYGKETEAFWKLYKIQLQEIGIKTTAWAKEQVEMRLGYARRLRRIFRQIKPKLNNMGIKWSPWMQNISLYYYYPEKLENAPAWVHELGEILVACEQLEAFSNRQRGSDYYNRSDENFKQAFNYLDTLKQKGQISSKVLLTVRKLTAQGLFDDILAESRKEKLTNKELDYLRSLEK